MVSHLCVCPHRLPSLCGFPMSWHSLYIRWLLQLGAVTVFCEIFGEKSQSVTQQGPMTSGCHPCLSRCLETEESEIFGKLQDEFQEITDATRARARVAPITDIRYIRILSRGAFGKVYLVSDKQTGQFFAMKEIIKKGIYMLREQNVEKEHIVMIKVQCPWTVEFLNLYESPFKQCILMEFIPGRNLLEELVVKKSLTVKQIRVYAAEMLACIFSVHRHGYIHSDIKLTNFMLDSYNHIKMCDFGLCVKFLLPHQCLELYPPHLNFWEVPDTSVLAQWHEIKDTHVQMFSIPHGTSYYCAPEVIKFTYKNWSMYGNNGFTFTCDFWSYGVCLYYLLFGHLPFYSRDKLQIPRLIIYWEQTLNLKSKRFIPDSGLDLIKKLICDERSRLGANGFHEIACHSFFDNIRWEGLGYRRNPTEIPGPDTLESPDSPEESEFACNNFFPFLCRAKKRKETTYSLSMSRQRVSSLRRTEDELSRMSTVQRDGGDLRVTFGSVLTSQKPASYSPVARGTAASLASIPQIEMTESSVDYEYPSIDPPIFRRRVFQSKASLASKERESSESQSSTSIYLTAQTLHGW